MRFQHVLEYYFDYVMIPAAVCGNGKPKSGVPGILTKYDTCGQKEDSSMMFVVHSSQLLYISLFSIVFKPPCTLQWRLTSSCRAIDLCMRPDMPLTYLIHWAGAQVDKADKLVYIHLHNRMMDFSLHARLLPLTHWSSGQWQDWVSPLVSKQLCPPSHMAVRLPPRWVQWFILAQLHFTLYNWTDWTEE